MRQSIATSQGPNCSGLARPTNSASVDVKVWVSAQIPTSRPEARQVVADTHDIGRLESLKQLNVIVCQSWPSSVNWVTQLAYQVFVVLACEAWIAFLGTALPVLSVAGGAVGLVNCGAAREVRAIAVCRRARRLQSTHISGDVSNVLCNG